MATATLADARAKLKTAARVATDAVVPSTSQSCVSSSERATMSGSARLASWMLQEGLFASCETRVQMRVASPLHTQAPVHNQQPSRRRGLFNLEHDRRLLCSSFILALALEGLAYVVLIAVEE